MLTAWQTILYKLYLLLLCTKLCCIYLMLLVERCPVENCGSQRLATASPFNTVCCGTDNALLLRGSYKTRSAQTLARVVWASFAPRTDKKPFVDLFFILFALCFLSRSEWKVWWGEWVVVVADGGGRATELRRLAWRRLSDMGNARSVATGPQQTIAADTDVQPKSKPSLLFLLLFYQCFYPICCLSLWSIIHWCLCFHFLDNVMSANLKDIIRFRDECTMVPSYKDLLNMQRDMRQNQISPQKESTKGNYKSNSLCLFWIFTNLINLFNTYSTSLFVIRLS